MQTSKFKNSESLAREQWTEALYTAGIVYTDSPIAEPRARMLVNFDCKANAGPLQPRPGVRTAALAVHPIKAEVDNSLTYTPRSAIQAVKECNESTVTIGQAIVSDLTTFVQDPTSELIKGKAWVMTALPLNTTAEEEYPPAVGDAPVHELQTRALFGSTALEEYNYFRSPSNMGIHGLLAEDSVAMSRLVGTFAYGNRYFSFRKVVTGPQLQQTKYDETLGYFVPELLTPKEITPKEAVLWGYNMLKTHPYSFENGTTTGIIQLLGILPYNSAGTDLIMAPVVNQTLFLHCFYDAPNPSTYSFKWEWREPGSTEWTLLRQQSVDTGAGGDAVCMVSFPRPEVILRVTATNAADVDQIQVLSVGFNFNKGSYGSTTSAQPVEYNLEQSKGLVHWNNRLVAYGPPKGENMLFMSEINDPTYFPYPNNAEVFNEPILYAIPLMSDLLVFTASELYVLSGSADGLAWSKKLIQSGLNIREQDIHLVQPVKNMLFFKSDNYYHMVVPSVKTASALAVAPISENIRALLDEFPTVVGEIFSTLYNYTGTFNLVHYHNYLDFENVCNNYCFRLASGKLVNLVLLYNTVTRAWRIHIHGTPHITYPYRPDSTTRGQLMSLTPIGQRMLIDGTVVEKTTVCLQRMMHTPDNNQDTCYTGGRYAPALSEVLTDDSEIALSVSEMKNYQMLDTGNREHKTDLKKRYRELQLKLNNISKAALQFYSDFFLDGGMRKGRYQYVTQHDTDPESPTYGQLYVEQIPLDLEEIPVVATAGITVLAEAQTEDTYWTLDNSMFPDISFWKIRIPVSGKGYTPRMVLVSINEKPFELLSNTWVFREMFSR